MVRQGGGAIVNCSSVGGFTGNPGIASYIASKHSVIGLTRTAALEYVKQGIRQLLQPWRRQPSPQSSGSSRTRT